jgi:hypothetical protein
MVLAPFAVAELTSCPVNKLSLNPASPALAAGPFLATKVSRCSYLFYVDCAQA